MSGQATLQLIPVSSLRASPYQYRTRFDDPKQQQLVESIRAGGLSTPILVRPIPAFSPSSQHTEASIAHELVSGERRWRAAKVLGLAVIPAIVEEMTDLEAAARVVTENEVRTDTNIIEKAASYRQLTQPPCFMTLEQIAKRYGLNAASSVKRVIDLLEQPEAIRDLLSQDKIGEAHVRFFSRIKDLNARSKWAKRAAEEGWSVRETEGRVAKILAKSHGAARKSLASRAPQNEYDYCGFHCALIGDEVVLSGRNFKRSKDSMAQFIADYQSALECFLRDLGSPSAHPGNPAELAVPSTEPDPAAARPRDAADPVGQPSNRVTDQPAVQHLKQAASDFAAALGLTDSESKNDEVPSLSKLIDFFKGPKSS